MKILVVYTHPLRDSFTGQILDSFVRGATEAGHSVDINDLYANGFQPVMTASELVGPKRAVSAKGHFIIIFPGGKTELAVAALVRANEVMIGSIAEFTEQANHDAAGTIRLFCNYFINKMLQSNYRRGTPISLTTLDAASTVDEIQEQVEIGYKWIIELIQDLLMRKGVDAETAYRLGNITLSAVEGALVVSAARRTIEPLEIVRDHLIEQLTVEGRGN